MASLLTLFSFGRKLIKSVADLGVGITRSILRGVISAAIKLEGSLPEIVEEMKKTDPNDAYGEWVTQYRQTLQGNALEQKLASWNPLAKIDESVLTSGPFRRARNYRYIFSALVKDEKMGTETWKRFSMYSNDLMSPNELREKFQAEYFKGNYENSISIIDIALNRVWKRTPFKQK